MVIIGIKEIADYTFQHDLLILLWGRWLKGVIKIQWK